MFIVLESIDGGGKGRQREEIEKYYKAKGVNIRTMGFPDHNNCVWREYIHPALHKEKILNKFTWFVGFAFDKAIWQEEIKKYKSDPNNLFIVDGYYTTTLVYQCLIQGFPSLDFGVKFSEEMGMVKPDLTIYLDVNPKVAMLRKYGEDGKDEKDMFESDVAMQAKIQAGFNKLIDEKIWCEWKVIDGGGTIEEVRDLVINEVQELKLNLNSK
ncbi:hypothetical protein KBD45_01895 [Candidatus Dojkabacteria bacterium]|nr:hypothetical protein [Candidatus Dojkabacteria bacterium]